MERVGDWGHIFRPRPHSNPYSSSLPRFLLRGKFFPHPHPKHEFLLIMFSFFFIILILLFTSWMNVIKA